MESYNFYMFICIVFNPYKVYLYWFDSQKLKVKPVNLGQIDKESYVL